MFLVCVEYDGYCSYYGGEFGPFDKSGYAKQLLSKRLTIERERLTECTVLTGENGEYTFSGVDAFGERVIVKGRVFRLSVVA